MNDTMKLLDQAFYALCDISVKGPDVERMAMAKALVRQARDLEEQKEKERTAAATASAGEKVACVRKEDCVRGPRES